MEHSILYRMTVKYLLNNKLAKYPKSNKNENEPREYRLIFYQQKRHDREKRQMSNLNV